MSKSIKTVIICDICNGDVHKGQGYGLRGNRSELKYTNRLDDAEKHICNGCMVSICWIFDHSVGKKQDKPELRY